jgi:hypothetical protein
MDDLGISQDTMENFLAMLNAALSTVALELAYFTFDWCVDKETVVHVCSGELSGSKEE